MQDQFHWIDTTGGPHVIAPVESLPKWRGIEGWTDNGSDDQSDYGRACHVQSWLGKMSFGTGCEAIVLSGDVGPVAWVPNPTGGTGVLIQWLACDDENAVLALLKNWQAKPPGERPHAEALDFVTGASGAMKLFDSSEIGGELGETGLTIILLPGRYRILAALVETENCAVVLREITMA